MTLTTTLLVMTYNQAPYVAAALESAFAQDEQGLEILVSDNFSSDETAAVIRRTLQSTASPHPVRFNARTNNSGGPASHINLVAPLVTTDLLVLQAGDDVAAVQRVRRIREAFAQDERVMAVYHGARVIDDADKDLGGCAVPHPPDDEDTQLWFASANRYALGACLAIRRSLLDSFPPLPTNAHEDVLLPFRAALIGRVVFLPLELLSYRQHQNNLSHEEHLLSTPAAYHQSLIRNKAKAEEIARVKLADIAWAQEKQWIDDGRAAQLCTLAWASVADHDLGIGLSSASLRQRLLSLWRARRRHRHLRQFAGDLLQVLSPRLHLFRRQVQRRRQRQRL